jgi:hypothetical protein
LSPLPVSAMARAFTSSTSDTSRFSRSIAFCRLLLGLCAY